MYFFMFIEGETGARWLIMIGETGWCFMDMLEEWVAYKKIINSGPMKGGKYEYSFNDGFLFFNYH